MNRKWCKYLKKAVTAIVTLLMVISLGNVGKKVNAFSGDLKADINSASFNLYIDQQTTNTTLLALLGKYVDHTQSCVQLSDASISDPSGVLDNNAFTSNYTIAVTGKIGTAVVTMTAATSGCATYGTQTATAATMNIVVGYSQVCNFIQTYLGGTWDGVPGSNTYNSTYTIATGHEAIILSAIDTWNALSTTDKNSVNTAINAANPANNSFEDFLVTSFIKQYATIGNSQIVENTNDSSAIISSGASDWNKLSTGVKNKIDNQLKESGVTNAQSYTDLLAIATARNNALKEINDAFASYNKNDYYATSVESKQQGAKYENDNWSKLESYKNTIVSKIEACKTEAQVSALASEISVAKSNMSVVKTIMKIDADAVADANEWKNNNSTILSKVEKNSVTLGDKTAMDNALNSYNALTPVAKAKVANEYTALTKIYEKLITQVKAFVGKYLTGKDGGVYKLATKDNYKQILSGLDDWKKMSQEQKDAVNSMLILNGGKNYDDLLKDAQVILKELSKVKTGDESDFTALYLLAASGLVGVYLFLKREVNA